MTEITCTLPEADRATRQQALRRGLLGRLRETRELPNGFALRFDADAATKAEVRDFIAFEEGCCGFATFATETDTLGHWLHVTGPDGTKTFVEALLAETTGATSAPKSRGWLRLGLGSGAAAVFAALCCTPIALGLLAAATGLEAGLLGAGLDAAAGGLALCGAVGVGGWFWHRRGEREPDSSCGC